MSRFSVTFSIDPGKSSQTFQPLTPQQSAKRLMQTTKGFPKSVAFKRVPTELRERTNFDKIIQKQRKALAKLKVAVNKNAIRTKLSEQFRSQRRSSNTNKTSSPSKREDFGEVLERQKKGLSEFKEAVNKVIEEQRRQRKSMIKKKKEVMARDLARELSKKETDKEREQRELDEYKIKLQKQKDVVDLWNTIVRYMNNNDFQLIDKTKFPKDLKTQITSDIRKTYKYIQGDKVKLERVEFNYFDKFHPENQRTFSERRLVYKDSDLPTILDPEPEVDFYLEFDKDNVNDIKSMCLRLRNHEATSRPIDYYWLYIEATPLKDGKKAGESKYESFYTFETKQDLFERILESRIHRNNVLRRQKQEQAKAEAEAQLESQSRTFGKKKKTRGKGSVRGKRSRRR